MTDRLKSAVHQISMLSAAAVVSALILTASLTDVALAAPASSATPSGNRGHEQSDKPTQDTSPCQVRRADYQRGGATRVYRAPCAKAQAQQISFAPECRRRTVGMRNTEVTFCEGAPADTAMADASR